MNINLNPKQKVIAINAILFAALFGLITLNKELFRPTFNNSDLLKILTGCFPNFIAAYIISLTLVSPVVIRKIKYGKLIVYISSMLVSVILIVEELKPMWGASEHYDNFDIIASLVGSCLAVICFELLIRIKKRREV